MKFVAVPLIVAAFVLSACGSKNDLVGAYTNTTHKKPMVVLKADGKATYMGVMELDYKVEGNSVKLQTPEGVLVLKVNDDGTLTFPLIGKLTKVAA
jgi:hypothetical protein